MVVYPSDSFSTSAWARYLVAFTVAAAIGCPITLFYELRITNCSGYGYTADAYLAQCSSKTYGDYEHGGLGLQIERAATNHLHAAQVVVIGHSHAMNAFSTLPTQQYFHEKGITLYNASFSAEFSGFYDFLLERLPLKAKVLVIDVAPFFMGETMSSAARFIVEHPIRAASEYWIKHIWQIIHRNRCSAVGWTKSLLCGEAFGTFRLATDGSLVVDYTRLFGTPLPKYPVGIYKRSEEALIGGRVSLAREFFSRHRLNAACTILTVVPTGVDFSDEAQAVAEALHAPYVNPSIEHLTTFDSAHLDPASAVAWSEQFWREANPVIDRCLRTSQLLMHMGVTARQY
jgi:hypothetical protein